MNRRHSVEQSLLRQLVGRRPCFPLVDLVFACTVVGRPMAQLQLDPVVHAAALRRCLDTLPIDGVYINLCLSPQQAAATSCRDGRYHLVLDDCLEVEFAEHDVASVRRTDVRWLDDERMLRAQLFHPGMLATFQALPPAVQQEAAVCVGLTGTFSQLGFLFGLENLLIAMVDRPEEVDRALRARHVVVLRQAAELCQAGARFIWIGEGMASGSLISPDMYRRFALPYERELAQEIRRLGGLSLLHICGNTSKMLTAIADSGVDGCDVDYPTDWAAAVATLGPRMCVKGNINPLLFLPDGVERLAAACEETKRPAAALPGFVLSTGCLVPRDSIRRAFEIMAAACSQPLS